MGLGLGLGLGLGGREVEEVGVACDMHRAIGLR